MACGECQREVCENSAQLSFADEESKQFDIPAQANSLSLLI